MPTKDTAKNDATGSSKIIIMHDFDLQMSKLLQAKAICIAMPSFEEEDKPEYVTISQHGIDTIIIDDD